MQLALSPFQLAGCVPKWDIELSGPVTVGTMPWKEGQVPCQLASPVEAGWGLKEYRECWGGGAPSRKEDKEEEVTVLCLCWLQAKF